MFRLSLPAPFTCGGALLLLLSCNAPTADTTVSEEPAPPMVQVEAESYLDANGQVALQDLPEGEGVASEGTAWLAYAVDLPVAGRYRCEIQLSAPEGGTAWLEDYYENKDGRTYNITGALSAPAEPGFQVLSVDGSPLNRGAHPLKLHLEGKGLTVDWVRFTLMREHQPSPQTLTQATEGEEWSLVWADEFDGQGLPDTSKWTFDLGNWGWGNNEPQYYTEYRTENARQEDGNLIIEARKNDMDQPWTSARLTTRGKTSFLYGKIEFRAKVPAGDGAWAAGWTLGDAYVDELSWPYCGEIDILETTGKEIDDATGEGINHASCHTAAYYFKKNNHITATLPVDDLVNEFHTYAIEWDSNGVRAFLDGEHYYTYDKTADQLEWPFSQPQNLIINLAMGGGMGGEIDPALTSQQLIVDYVRVYERH
ncbi:MAG: family 16 glycosylhydrolase [Saprospiraceae bacterium]|nr:family 16 glycosylhydrolase [Saprospiraceae bacterium]MCB0681403.1 family 16 glycosylhydrolase [Saprospiraceae bacterium]